MLGALGNWFILKCCSALTTFVFVVWVAEGWEVSLTQQDGPELCDHLVLLQGIITPKPALQHQLNCQ